MSKPSRVDPLDAVIVGGGPAGLSAAFWLARYRRRVRLYDDGAPRNRMARAVHGYPGLADPPPAELLRRIRAQAADAGASLAADRVVAVTGAKDEFRIDMASGAAAHARRIVLAYGCHDAVPEIPGLAAAYGITIHHCPDCDGPDALGEPVGVIGWTRAAAALALFLLTWAGRVVLLAHGRADRLDDVARDTLRRKGVAVRGEAVVRVVQRDGQVEGVELAGGERVPLRRIFLHVGVRPASDLAERLGCRTTDGRRIIVDEGRETTIPGIYAVGDIAGRPHLTVAAAAAGVCAALAIHRSLLPSDEEL